MIRTRTETRELAALRERVIRREEAMQRDAYRHLQGKHITDAVIAAIALVLIGAVVLSRMAGCTLEPGPQAPQATQATQSAAAPMPPVGDDGGN